MAKSFMKKNPKIEGEKGIIGFSLWRLYLIDSKIRIKKKKHQGNNFPLKRGKKIPFR